MCLLDLSNRLTFQATHIQSFTDRITSLRNTINTHIQHMNGTLDTIMNYATWSEKYVIHAQQHIDLSHAWMIQQQIWYTTWMKQVRGQQHKLRSADAGDEISEVI